VEDRKLGAAVIGLEMGNEHCSAFARNPHTRLLAVCDTDQNTLERVRSEHGARHATRDYRDILKMPDIDIVSVATPDFHHAEQSIAALEAGKDVLCEKPLTLDLKEALAIVAAVKRSGRRLMVGQVCRYAPGFALARRMIERGDIGELYLAESEYAHSYVGARGVGDWRVDPRREPVIGGGCHAVDLLRWIAGEVDEVFAYANHRCLTDWPVNDCTTASLRFRNGVIGRVMISIGCVRPYTMRSVFYGTEGTIVCDNTSPEIQWCGRKSSDGKLGFTSLPVDIASHNVAREIEELVEDMRAGRPVRTDVREGARTVATCVAIVESARLGEPVRVEVVS
jgi:predicted dehydrogenase